LLMCELGAISRSGQSIADVLVLLGLNPHRRASGPSVWAKQPIIGKISQETLAEIVGTTRSRVNVFMNKFRKLGFIEYNGVLEVHNSLLNGLVRQPTTQEGRVI
jgi:Crp-like helix-turn-helix domain